MKKGTTWVVAVISAILGGAPLDAAGSVSRSCPPSRSRPELAAEKTALVQIAILLDTSNSMDGLIDQARTQLWSIVNQFAAARRYGQAATLQVALYEYGNSRLTPQSGYVRRLLPFTTDLDRVSQELFALTTQGGDEFCGTVMQAALDQLAWSPSPAALKVIFIAGNEPFTQGETDYHNAVPVAVKKNIVINTIFCGNKDEGEKTNWKDGAVLGEGAYANIDQNESAPPIATPHDADLSTLSSQLNGTYLAYGRRAEEGKARQSEQDSNASSVAPAAAAARSVSKASGFYKNSSWDLVDALEEKTVELKDVAKDDLPKEMQSMTLEQREAHVKKLADQRKDVQSKIASLEVKRQAYIAAERLKQTNSSTTSTLGEALLKAVREQATRKGYTFDATK